MRKKREFSKCLLLLESLLVLYVTHEGVGLAREAISAGFGGSLPWLAAMVSAAWGAYGSSAAFYYNKAKAENTAGGIVFESARREQDCEARE